MPDEAPRRLLLEWYQAERNAKPLTLGCVLACYDLQELWQRAGAEEAHDARSS